MKNKKLILCAGLIILGGLASVSQAELKENGTGCIYSTELNISYLDINSGKMDWGAANTWINNFSWTNPFTGQEYSDWRLPVTRGTVLRSYEVTGGELGHLYYVELGNVKLVGLVNSGPFESLTIENPYWYGDDENATFTTYAPYFEFERGYQGELMKAAPFYVLPVHDGDVCATGSVAEICDDGTDNDNDGLIDCGDHYDCDGISYCVEDEKKGLCADGYDNDGDGAVDCEDLTCRNYKTCL